MNRKTSLEQLRGETFDLLVIGGGVTGAGVAFDAALRGLRVALVEKDDFASGTSSRSSKLLHGGLRYLQRLEVGLVYEGLHERREIARMAPHLVTPMRFLVPRYGSRRFGIRLGLTAYDVLSLGSRYPRHRHLDRDEARALAPALRSDVDGGLAYWDAAIDDARLVWTIVRSAIESGAVAVNHAEVVELVRSGTRVVAARVRDDETQEAIDVRARVVVNATGVWADDVRRLEAPDASIGIRPSRGVHIVFRSSRIPLRTALLVPTRDNRFVFVIPWEDSSVIVGTTDEDYAGPLDDPPATTADVAYLLAVVNDVLASRVGVEDIIATFAGLRPLIATDGAKSKDISRRHVVTAGPGGVITITGGKLTAWRPMAADAVNAALRTAGFERRMPSRTDSAELAGADPGERVLRGLEERLGLPEARRLWHRYGAHASDVLALADADPSLGEQLHPELPYLRAEAAYSISAEMARRPSDVLARRLRAEITSSDGGRAALEWVCDRLARAHGWTDARREAEAAAYR